MCKGIISNGKEFVARKYDGFCVRLRHILYSVGVVGSSVSVDVLLAFAFGSQFDLVQDLQNVNSNSSSVFSYFY